MGSREDRGLRDRTEALFGHVEDVLYVAIAAALALVGVGLFGYVVYDFVSKIGDGDVTAQILSLLDGLLLVFIITELIHTVRAVIDERVLVAEPFLLVGIVAAIRRLVVVSAEAKDLLGKPQFGDAMTEIGLLAGTVVVLAFAIFLLRNTERSEPTSEHEPG